jgi:hypothetical protein
MEIIGVIFKFLDVLFLFSIIYVFKGDKGMYDYKLHAVVSSNSIEMVDQLTKGIFAKQKINARGPNDLTVLMDACGNGSTPFSLAAVYNHVNIGILLMENNIDFALKQCKDISSQEMILRFEKICLANRASKTSSMMA